MSQEAQTPQAEEQYQNIVLPIESEGHENAEQTLKSKLFTLLSNELFIKQQGNSQKQGIVDNGLEKNENEEESQAKLDLTNQINNEVAEASRDVDVDIKTLSEKESEQEKPQEGAQPNEELAKQIEKAAEPNQEIAQPNEIVTQSNEEVAAPSEESAPNEEDKSNIIQENNDKKEDLPEPSEKSETQNNKEKLLEEKENQEIIENKENQKIETQPQSSAEEQDSQMYTVEKRIQMANELNNQAREFIKKKNHPEALQLYQKALELTNPTYFRYVGDEMKKEYQTLSVNLLNNLAFCYFHLGNFLVSAQISEQTLIIDPKNLKAMYRRAICYKNLKDYERAFEIIKTAVKNGGNESKEIYGEYESIKALHKEYVEQYKQKEKEVYGRMMSSASQQKIQEEKEKELLREKAALEVASDAQTLVNSLFFFGSTAFSFLVASKVFKIDVTSKTGFSLAGSISTTLYGAYHFENKYAKGIFGLCAFILFGYMMNKKSIAN